MKPLLVMDGDSFAHRAYHGVPKTVRRKDGRAGNMLMGVSNYLVRFWQGEQVDPAKQESARAVLRH